jgi:uncharacterized protein (TIGR03083 family)
MMSIAAERAGAPVDRIGALVAETEAVLRFCADLSPDEWNAPSQATGWRVRDVIAHLGGSCRLMFSVRMVELLRTNEVERFNDKLVAKRRAMSPAELLAEYRTWSPRVARLFRLTAGRPLGSIPLRVGELGWYPMRLIPSALTFDAHIHLRHDIAPALGRPVPAIDARSTGVALEWLLDMLEDLNASERRWLDQPLLLTLTGPGGGCWLLVPTGGGRLRVKAVEAGRDTAAGAIRGEALDFPVWTTRRRPWRDCGLVLEGDTGYASRFLDTVHLV